MPFPSLLACNEGASHESSFGRAALDTDKSLKPFPERPMSTASSAISRHQSVEATIRGTPRVPFLPPTADWLAAAGAKMWPNLGLAEAHSSQILAAIGWHSRAARAEKSVIWRTFHRLRCGNLQDPFGTSCT